MTFNQIITSCKVFIEENLKEIAVELIERSETGILPNALVSKLAIDLMPIHGSYGESLRAAENMIGLACFHKISKL